jgi:hypothetical protein
MIGSWFALPHPTTPGATWGWEVVAADGVTVASGVSAGEAGAGLDCQLALRAARDEAGEGVVTDVALLRAPARFGGRWAAPAARSVA